MAQHGTRQCYAEGCRRPECKLAQSKYRRELKARNAGAVVTDIRRPGRPRKDDPRPTPISMTSRMQAKAKVPATDIAEIGPAETAVTEELASMTSAETRKGAAQAALAMARILDNPLALTQQPAAATRLTTILDDLRKGSARRKGRLASVQALTKPTGGSATTGT